MTADEYWNENHIKIVNGEFMSYIQFCAYAKDRDKQVLILIESACKKQREICAMEYFKNHKPNQTFEMSMKHIIDAPKPEEIL